MTITAVYDDPTVALAVAESSKEVAPNVRIRVLVPGSNAPVVTVVNDKRGWFQVAIMGFILGLVGAYVFDSMGAGWAMGFVGWLTGTLGGLMLGFWLQGEAVFRGSDRTLEKRFADLIADGKSVLYINAYRNEEADKIRAIISKTADLQRPPEPKGADVDEETLKVGDVHHAFTPPRG